MIKLGGKVKDFITGFEGIAIARCIYLNGCIRIEVQPQELKKGKPAETLWFDEGQLYTAKETKVESKKEKPPGGPGSIPSKISHP